MPQAPFVAYPDRAQLAGSDGAQFLRFAPSYPRYFEQARALRAADGKIYGILGVSAGPEEYHVNVQIMRNIEGEHKFWDGEMWEMLSECPHDLVVIDDSGTPRSYCPNCGALGGRAG